MGENDENKSGGHYRGNLKQYGDDRYNAGQNAKPLLVKTDSSGQPINEVGNLPEKQGLLDQGYNSQHAADWKKTEAEADEPAPVDRWNLVYFILMLHGIGTLMPWNMFITATGYFVDYKLATLPDEVLVSASLSGNGTGNLSINGTGEPEKEMTMYQRYFLSSLGFTAQIPNLLLNMVNLFCQCGGGNITKRIIWSIIIVVFMFIVTVVLAMIDSSEWPGGFFWITMVTVVIINMANGVYQNSVYGTAACLPMKYTNAVVLGSNISGTLASVISIISIASTPNPRTSAIYYFLSAIFVLLIAFDTYFALPLIPFYRYYNQRALKAQEKQHDGENTRPPFLEIFRKCWVQDLSVFFVFFVTLTCFPAIMASIKRSSGSFPISEKFYTPVTCFLFFNAFAMLGNLTSEFIKQPGPRWVWLPVLLRGLFIPFFMLCNFNPDERALPIFIPNDYIYCVGGIIMAFTSGYYSSLTMMFAPRCVEPQHQGIAGMMAAFFLILGIFSGVVFSFPVIIFIENVG